MGTSLTTRMKVRSPSQHTSHRIRTHAHAKPNPLPHPTCPTFLTFLPFAFLCFPLLSFPSFCFPLLSFILLSFLLLPFAFLPFAFLCSEPEEEEETEGDEPHDEHEGAIPIAAYIA